VFDFCEEKTFSKLFATKATIKTVVNSPIVDIIAIGLSNGHIALFNIKSMKIV